MTLRRRLFRLEARHVPACASDARPRLAATLARIEAVVVAPGDASDCVKASPAERMVRRYLRGDVPPAQAVRDLIERRWP
jgi:hypothetical protein